MKGSKTMKDLIGAFITDYIIELNAHRAYKEKHAV